MTKRRSSRRRVLDALRAVRPAPTPLPELPPAGPPAGVAAFLDAAERAGAVAEVLAGGEAGLRARLAAYAPWVTARRVVSVVPGLPGAETPGGASDHPHTFADVDVAVVRAEFGVAENGALWFGAEDVPHRAVYLLAQHLIAVVPAEEIVADLHAAYERIGSAEESVAAQSWRGFIAGPSKTADIEQALVIGAHGPRSLLICLV